MCRLTIEMKNNKQIMYQISAPKRYPISLNLRWFICDTPQYTPEIFGRLVLSIECCICIFETHSCNLLISTFLSVLCFNTPMISDTLFVCYFSYPWSIDTLISLILNTRNDLPCFVLVNMSAHIYSYGRHSIFRSPLSTVFLTI